jgi:hypothetical protein
MRPKPITFAELEKFLLNLSFVNLQNPKYQVFKHSEGDALFRYKPMVIFVDVDDTIVRSFGTKRIPIPTVIEAIRQLFAQGETLYCYARSALRVEYSITPASYRVWIERP